MWGEVQGGIKNDVQGFAGSWVAGGTLHLAREQRIRRFRGEKEKCFRHSIWGLSINIQPCNIKNTDIY